MCALGNLCIFHILDHELLVENMLPVIKILLILSSHDWLMMIWFKTSPKRR